MAYGNGYNKNNYGNKGGYNKGGYNKGGKGGGFQKKEFDPTIVSAKDVMMARMNAVTAATTLQAALITAGKPLTDDEFNALVEETFTKHVEAADHARVGSASKSSLKKADKIAKAAGLEEVDDDDAPGSFEVDFGQYDGQTIAEIYEEDEDYVTEYLANKDKMRNRKDVLKAVKAFLKSLDSDDDDDD